MSNNKEVSYRISFDDIEINGFNAHQAIKKAVELLKKEADSVIVSKDRRISWEETHNEECECINCMEEKGDVEDRPEYLAKRYRFDN